MILKEITISPQAKTQTFEGFHFLRAIFSILIVALRSDFIGLIGLLTVASIGDFLKANIAYVAVPVFLQISLFLFYFKREQLGGSYFIRKRLPKLIYLYVFWVTAIVIFDIFLNKKPDIIRDTTSSVKGLIEFIVSGGSSPFFFFFALIFLISLAEGFVLSQESRAFSKNIKLAYSLLFISCLIVCCFSFIDLTINNIFSGNPPSLLKVIHNITKWDYNPLNFLPYVFTAAITFHEFEQGKMQSLTPKFRIKLCLLFALFIVFTILEWSFREDFRSYARLSLAFGSWLLLYLSLILSNPVPKVIKFLSGCSLGIYAFHVFFVDYSGWLDQLSWGTSSQSSASAAILIKFSFALVASILLTLGFRKNGFLKNFV